MQLIHSLTCQTADSASTDVCCLTLLFVCFVFNCLTLPVKCFLTIFICSLPLHFHLYKNICRKWENIHKSMSYFPTRFLASCCLNVIQHYSENPANYLILSRHEKEKPHKLWGTNPPNLRHATFLQKSSYRCLRTRTIAAARSDWGRKVYPYIFQHKSKIFLYGLRLQSLNLRKASGIYSIWSPLLRESSHRSRWTIVSLIPSHAVQHISCSREHSDNVPKHTLENISA